MAAGGRLRALAGKVAAPVVAQGVTAAASLLLQVVAARSLGLAEFGAFALFLALLVSASALYIGYIGDSMAVLDRHDATVRPALVTSALAAVTLCCAAAVGTALVLRHGDLMLALLFAATVAAWLVRESVRRLLIARQEFRRLVGNDCGYLVVVAATLGGFQLVSGMSLTALFAAMTAGALVTVGLGVAGLPRHELGRLRPGLAGLGELASFAAWRSAQATLRPAALLLVRVLVANLVSLAAVGVLEAGRLVVAPLQVVINGAGSYLLAGFAAAERAGRAGRDGLAGRAGLLLVTATVLAGAVLALLAGPVGRLMTGAGVDRLLVLGWVAYLAVWAAGLPYITEVVARRRSRAVFGTRLVDSVLGLGLAAAALAAGAGVAWVPWLMAAGGLYAVLRMRALAVATRPAAPAARS